MLSCITAASWRAKGPPRPRSCTHTPLARTHTEQAASPTTQRQPKTKGNKGHKGKATTLLSQIELIRDWSQDLAHYSIHYPSLLTTKSCLSTLSLEKETGFQRYATSPHNFPLFRVNTIYLLALQQVGSGTGFTNPCFLPADDWERSPPVGQRCKRLCAWTSPAGRAQKAGAQKCIHSDLPMIYPGSLLDGWRLVSKTRFFRDDRSMHTAQFVRTTETHPNAQVASNLLLCRAGKGICHLQAQPSSCRGREALRQTN